MFRQTAFLNQLYFDFQEFKNYERNTFKSKSFFLEFIGIIWWAQSHVHYVRKSCKVWLFGVFPESEIEKLLVQNEAE